MQPTRDLKQTAGTKNFMSLSVLTLVNTKRKKKKKIFLPSKSENSPIIKKGNMSEEGNKAYHRTNP